VHLLNEILNLRRDNRSSMFICRVSNIRYVLMHNECLQQCSGVQ